jgi:hypothetical protein
MNGGALNGYRILPPCFRRLCGLSPRFFAFFALETVSFRLGPVTLNSELLPL